MIQYSSFTNHTQPDMKHRHTLSEFIPNDQRLRSLPAEYNQSSDIENLIEFISARTPIRRKQRRDTGQKKFSVDLIWVDK